MSPLSPTNTFSICITDKTLHELIINGRFFKAERKYPQMTASSELGVGKGISHTTIKSSQRRGNIVADQRILRVHT